MVSWKCRFVLMALSTNEEEVEGVYIASTQNLTITHNLPNSVGPIQRTPQTDLVHNVTVRHFGGTDMSTRWDQFL